MPNKVYRKLLNLELFWKLFLKDFDVIEILKFEENWDELLGKFVYTGNPRKNQCNKVNKSRKIG